MVPALYVAGDRDFVLGQQGPDELVARMRQMVPRLREAVLLPGCGHWTQQERPGEVSRAIIEFAGTLG
jgi:pimeloyl-ACP methyl ester carboxylesterase